jgi:hypothetical protein
VWLFAAFNTACADTRNLQIAEGGVLPLLRKSFSQKDDIFLVNFGAWHRRSSGDMTDYYTALHDLGKYYQVMILLSRMTAD